ncbi:unnamed protein product [Kuraishia capsulata CBS 1993]|uniref:Exocyst complex component Sec10-like alpha-helical bundle domain-containing protein n=1 Tax=Kuraishia capsulata CBS 1993 TaxID=1382522 RepID=W6MT22_9ASCO|nr:uncharacterized protein KUCA_T00005976001 [Kuraishia capsulata CBS 1993]CDK29981.1 unnamed protein product [Kuraishia capsulata CBS 1993]
MTRRLVPPANRDEGQCLKQVALRIRDIPTLLSFGLASKACHAIVFSTPQIWIRFLRQIQFWDPKEFRRRERLRKEGNEGWGENRDRVQQVLSINEEMTPINCLDRPIYDPDLALEQFRKIYSLLAPILRDLVVKNYSNFQKLNVFVKYNTPESQSLLFHNVSRFINIFKFTSGFKSMAIRLNAIVEVFANSVVREIDINYEKRDHKECFRLIKVLNNLSLENYDSAAITVESSEKILEFFINKYVESYVFLTSDNLVEKTIVKVGHSSKRGVVKGHEFLFASFDDILSQIGDILNSQFEDATLIFQHSTDERLDQMPIILKIMETLLSSYLIGGFCEELISRAKEIDATLDMDIAGIEEPIAVVEKPNETGERDSLEDPGDVHDLDDLERLASPTKAQSSESDPRINVMNESSLYFQVVPHVYQAMIQTFKDLKYPQSRLANGEDYFRVATELINFYYEPNILEFIELLPRQCHASLVLLVDAWEGDLTERENIQQQEILKMVTEQDKDEKKLFKLDIISGGKEILTGFTNIFKMSKSETNEMAKDTRLDEHQNKTLTKFAANLQILTNNVNNITSLVSMDLTVYALQHVKNSFTLLMSLYGGDEGHTTTEVREKINHTCQEIYNDALTVLIDTHIKTGFDEAISRLRNYNPTELKSMMDNEHNSEVEPLRRFVELVNVADLIQQMISIFYEEELVAKHIVYVKAKQKRDFLSANKCEKTMAKLESMLDSYVADGFSISIDVIINELTYAILKDLDEKTYAISENDLAKPEFSQHLGSASSWAVEVVRILNTHFRLLSGSIEKQMVDVFRQEIGERFVRILIKLITKKLTISTTGAIFLISDLNHFYNFFLGLRQKTTVGYLTALKTISQLYLIDGSTKQGARDVGKLVMKIGRDNGMFSPEEVYQFVSRRSDWNTIKTDVDKIMYGLGIEDCQIV